MTGPASIWLRTEPDIDGTYRLSLELGDDESIFLDIESALAHASYVLAMVSVAEFEAKVFKQLDELTHDKGSAGQMIIDLRADRALAEPPTRLKLTPGVSIFTGKGFLDVSFVGGQPFGQWDLEAARRHALAAIEGIHIADYDSAYLRALVGVVGLDEDTARSVVGALSQQ